MLALVAALTIYTPALDSVLVKDRHVSRPKDTIIYHNSHSLGSLN